MKIKIILLILNIIVFSCKRENQTISKNNIKFIPIQFEPRKSLLPYDIFSDISYIPLETTPESLLGDVDKVIIKDGKIYILDMKLKNSLFVFDLNGKFLFKIDRKGKGPGEYIDLRDFTLDDNNIILNTFGQLLYFDHKGNYKYSIKSDIIFNNFIYDDLGNVFLFQDCESCNKNIVSKHVLVTDNKFEKIKYEYFEPIRQEPLKSYRFQRLENKILLTAPQYLDNTIYELSYKSCLPCYTFDFGKYNVPTNVVNNKEINFNDDNLHNFAVIDYIKESSNYIYCLFNHGTWCYVTLISKRNKKTYTGFNIDSIPFFHPEMHELKDNKLFAIIPSFIFTKVNLPDVDNITNYKLKKIYQKSKTIKNSTSINDNPILVIYELNF